MNFITGKYPFDEVFKGPSESISKWTLNEGFSDFVKSPSKLLRKYMEQDIDNSEAFDREIEAVSDLIKGMLAF